MIKVFLVTGGLLTEFEGQKISSTELLVDGAGSWSLAGDLPVATYGIRVYSIV